MLSTCRLVSVAFLFQALAWCAATVLIAAPAPEPGAEPMDGVRIQSVRMMGDILETNPPRLLRSLRIAPGAPYDSVRVEAARRELLAMGWLRSIDLLVARPAPDSLSVVILVARAPRARLLPLVDLREDDRVVLGGQLYAWGRSGRGERFQLRVGGGGQELIQADWIEPRPFLRLPLGLRFGAELFQQVETAESEIEFDRLELQVAVSVPDRGPRLELSGAVLQLRASEPAGILSTGGVDHLRRGAVEFAWGGARRSFEWSAFRGRLGIGAVSGAAEYQDVHAQAQLALDISDRFVVAAGWAYRDVRGVVPRYDRLHLGGGPTLRAQRYAVVNGDAGTSGGVELRVPVNFWSPESFGWTTMPLVVHLFADAGAAWSASAPGASTEAPDRASARLRWSAGLGATAYFRGTYPVRANFGSDERGVWRADLSTSFPF